ncbi:MAG: 5,6-dimethylbenzimidazole synthase [Kiloniellales bacterium]|nr:5,6-dimethylbenzimidazole synthase [Kiloniellales bacterium]
MPKAKPQSKPGARGAAPPLFDPAFRARLCDLLAWRRDVRRFRSDPLPEADFEALLDLACLAPSVGHSQPWRFVRVDDPTRRAAVIADFERCNAEALADYDGPRRRLYAGLKLSGLQEAPLHLAVFADETTASGAGLGRRTMPETLRYSAVLAVHTLWLAARARGLGLGWVSILDPEEIAACLEVPAGWRFIAYLCLGYPVEEHVDPELERHGWQGRDAACRRVLQR